LSEPVYERYKDALRQGHVAAMRGRLEAALVAYREAADIAPERALPHTSQGSVLARLGRHDEALAAFAAALDRAPRDEAALTGRSEELIAVGRGAEAAETLDRLADVLEAADRPAEASDVARRALELAESDRRRQLVERLEGRVRSVPADAAVATALEHALQVLEPDAGTSVQAAGEPTESAAAPTDAAPAPPEATPERADTAPDATGGVAGPPGSPTMDGPDLGPILTAEAELLVMGGDPATARERCLAAAGAHRAAGRPNAAMDACYLGLSIAPGDPALHLTLAELFVERGWRGPAAEKLLLLARLVDLAADADTRQRLCALVRARFGDDPRLTAVCG
jgi:tetratricopeptide (TPR) repeat protein